MAKVISLLGMEGDPQVVEVGHKAIVPNLGGLGVYVLVRVGSDCAHAYFTSKGELVEYSRWVASSPLPNPPRIRVRQW